ncbi:SusC/RagA family TonB-linked outer membrane protein [Gelidibacter japonicus]|uniref:SusC/RagA family TonB-linked outer membrane protein n=1 Tax=Gelidibacter japonicus TaxID=1962232 RepID=UPI003A9486D8
MRTFILLCCTSALSFSSSNLFSQDAKVFIETEQTVTIFEVFELIAKQTDCTFIYQSDIFTDVPIIHLKYGEIKVMTLLSRCLPANRFEITSNKDNLITISRKPPKIPQKDLQKAQQQEIKGKIKDVEGMPIAGAAIMVVGTKRGSASDFDGRYSITAKPTDTLKVSYLGYMTLTIPIQNRGTINIVLQEDATALNEVQINAGYYNTTRRESTGHISRVTAEEIGNQAVISPLQALQGRMAGVEVISGGANPGVASRIIIRGRNSLRDEGNYPLYIIDGVPISSIPAESNSLLGPAGIDPLNNLNPSNIKSIEVLKDADATAIYGSRGANGVVLITTKSGNTVGTGIEARIYTGVSTVPRRLDLLNTPQYLQVREQAFENDGVEPTPRNAYDLLVWDQDRYTDWQDFLFGRQAETTSANLSFTGGSKNTSYRLGGSYYKQGTIYPTDFNYHKITGNLSLNHYSEDRKFNLGTSINYGIDNNELAGNLSLGSSVFTLPPNAPIVFNPDGSLNWEEWSAAGIANPLEGYFNYSITQTNRFIANVYLSYEVLEGLQLRTSFGYTDYFTDEARKLPARSYKPAANPQNRSAHLNTNRSSWIVEPQLTYNTRFGKFEGDFILGSTLQAENFSRQSLQGMGYASESLIGNLAAAESIINAQSSSTQYRYAALFSRLGFNWDKKYYVNLTGRRDGSSRFGPNNRFSNFGAIGVAWIFTEEQLIKDELPFLSFGKLRGSYGITGNDQIGDYGYLDAYEATTGPGGLYPTSLANPDYSWEVNNKMEAGLELGFLDDRLNFSLSWYRNRSSNQLVGYPLPAITGFQKVQANLPATVENRGFEVEFTSYNIRNNDFSWKTSFNLSRQKNELISYPDIEQSSYANVYKVGHPLNIALNFNYTGIDPETGLYTFQDVNEDGRLDVEDRIIIADRNKEFFGGIMNDFTYKNFNLQFLWEFVKQPGRLSYFNAGRPGNILGSYLSGNDFQIPTQSYQGGVAYNNALNSSVFNQDGSFLRLKTVSASYNLEKLADKLGFNQCQVFLIGQNLLTLTSYEGLDPESPVGGAFIGNLRTISGGLQLNF